MNSARPFRAGLVLACLTAAAFAAESEIGVAAAYVRMPPPGARVSAAFMVLDNPTGVARKLVRAQSPAAKVVELHTHMVHDGYMQMRKIDSIDIAAGGRVELKPGSFHLMLIDFRGGKEDEAVPISLFFDDGGSKQISVPLRRDVATPAAAGMGHGGGRH